MKLRQARKIMKNVRLYKGMIWLYGPGRVDKANNRMCKHYATGDERFKRTLQLLNADPLAFASYIRIIRRNKQ